MTTQRWTPVVSPDVTAHVLAWRHDVALTTRFWQLVDLGFGADDCHIWTGALSSEGYGVFSIPRRPELDRTRRVVRAHRIAWLWRHGAPAPEERPFLDHAATCVGRFCLNVAHLTPVNNDENMDAMRAAGTFVGAGPQRAMRAAELARRELIRATASGEAAEVW